MSRILAIRPEPGLSSTLDSARALGLDVVGEPLFEIQPLEWNCPDPGEVDALLIGSANAILHGGAKLALFKNKPVYAVGKTTAEAARHAGFEIAAIGHGGLQNVIDAVPAPTRLLRIAGAEHVALKLPDHVSVNTAIAYQSKSLSLNYHVINQLGSRPIVLLHSAAAARHFASECDRLGLKKEALSLAVLGLRIADAAGKGWGTVHVSAHPNDSDLLEMLRNICV